ncbi:MAG: PDZ domain-containing protein [Isosphaeraceae bacterium]
MRTRLAFLVAIALFPTLNGPARSYGQQAQGQPGQNPQQGQGDTVVGAIFGYSQQQQGVQPTQGQPGQNQLGSQQHQGSGQQRQGQQGQPNNAQQGRGQQGPNNNAQQNLNGWIRSLNDPVLTLLDSRNRNSGMSLAPADDALRAQLKLSKDEGLIVTEVEAGSPAALAGIEPNDVLLRLGGSPPKGIRLAKPDDLEKALKLVGSTPEPLQLLRGGQRISLMIQPQVRVSLGPVQPEPPTYWVGVSVASIEPALRAQLQLQPRFGLLALDVVKDSPASKAGLRPHDILLRLDSEALTDQDALIQIVQARGEKTIPLEIVREGKKETIAITPERRKSMNVAAMTEGPFTVNWDIVLPGGVLPGQPGGNTLEFVVNDLVQRQTVTRDANQRVRSMSVPPRAISSPKDSHDLNSATAKQLDDLSAQIKELRQAIDALTKAAQMKK